MDDLKKQLEHTLIANVIKSKCEDCDNLIFCDSWSSQDRVIRFATPFFKALFSCNESEKGMWHNGFFVMYEIELGTDQCNATCKLGMMDFPYSMDDVAERLKAVTKADSEDSQVWQLGSWQLADSLEDKQFLFDKVNEFIYQVLPAFENEIEQQMNEEKAADSYENIQLKEGTQYELISKKYERSAEARKKCLEAHGTVCAVCGMDFGKAFGPEFEGKIEVHHIVPISSIGKEYVVDPVKDLIPVCPNCHMLLHSKKNGVYTVDELKQMRKQK